MKASTKLRRRNSGIALIVVLGLLSCVTLLTVAFSIAMRIERLAARNNLNAARAEHLIQAAFVRATEDINGRMVGKCYPDVAQWPDDVLVSSESLSSKLVSGERLSGPCTSLLQGEAAWAIPQAFHQAAEEALKQDCRWIEIDAGKIFSGRAGMGTTRMRARLAYLVLNTSGLLDANQCGGGSREWKHVRELRPTDIALKHLRDFSGNDPDGRQVSVDIFVENRDGDPANRDDIGHCRYETISELAHLNQSCFHTYGAHNVVTNMMVYSLDVNRDQLFEEADQGSLGTPAMKDKLESKFYLNKITNEAAYAQGNEISKYKSDGAFQSGYLTELRGYLQDAGLLRVEDAAWNIINWLDPDRVPQSAESDGAPWVHTEGGEAIPLINEIAFRKTNPDPLNYEYEFEVEVFYPFTGPPEVQLIDDDDHFYLQMAYWDLPNPQSVAAGDIPMSKSGDRKHRNLADLPAGLEPTHVAEYQLTGLEFDLDTPQNAFMTHKLNFTADAFLADTNCVWFLARVVKTGEFSEGDPGRTVGGDWPSKMGTSGVYPVDQAGGRSDGVKWRYHNGTSWQQQNASRYSPVPYWEPGQWGVDDPRSNGKGNEWFAEDNFTDRALNKGLKNHPNVTDQTPWWDDGGSIPYVERRQGIPFYVKDGPMKTIGEVGYMYRSNYRGDVGTFGTIDLMHPDKGAYLLDHLTVRDPNRPNVWTNGLVCINSRQEDVLYALFGGVQVGMGLVPPAPGPGDPEYAEMQEEDIEIIVTEILRQTEQEPFVNFRTMFERDDDPRDQVPDLAAKIMEAAQQAWVRQNGDTEFKYHDRVLEDVFSQVIDLITFRQNMFTIICAAQVLPAETGGQAQDIVLAEKRAIATIYRDSYTGNTFTRSFKWLSDEL